MASLPRRLLLHSRKCPVRTQGRASPKHTTRALSTTPRRHANEEYKPGSYTPSAATPPGEQVQAVAGEAHSYASAELTEEETTAAQLASLVRDLKALDPAIINDAVRKGKRGIPFAADFELDRDEHFDIEEDDKRKVAAGFWAEGEESMGADEDYFGDDLTSHGHGELAQHRMLREYSRLIAWEMPLLHQLAKPFVLPTQATPFRFRYTSYLNESHPAANKVVVEFCCLDLGLSETARSKLIKLAGPRYNPSNSQIKLSCEKFDTQAQNKRFLGETISALMQEANDTTDSFADVPFDFRHHKPKKRWEFPKAWALTPERKQYLENKRAQQAKLDDERLQNGNMVDGKMVIDTSLPFAGEQLQEPVMVGAAKGKELR